MSIIADKEAAKLLENVSIAMLNSLNVSFSAVDIIMKKLDEMKNKELSEYMAMVRHSQYNLLYIAQNISELGTSAANETPYNFKAVELNELCADLIQTVSSLTMNTGISLSFKGYKTDLTITGDKSKLERMLLNLISNSFLHCIQGDRIILSADANDDFILLSVVDNGTGISRSSMSILFEDFLKDTDEYDPSKGVGLGISVAENIARMHGGSMIISSAEGSGTVATVSLPKSGGEMFGQSVNYEYGNTKMKNILTALSPVLDYKKYTSPYILEF